MLERIDELSDQRLGDLNWSFSFFNRKSVIFDTRIRVDVEIFDLRAKQEIPNGKNNSEVFVLMFALVGMVDTMRLRRNEDVL